MIKIHIVNMRDKKVENKKKSRFIITHLKNDIIIKGDKW